MRLRTIFATLTIAVSSFAAPILHAATSGPTYSAPVVQTFVGAGVSPGHAGGRTFNFTSVNTASFVNLYWGVGMLGSAMDGAVDEAGETLAFQSAVGAAATWTGTTSVSVVGNSNLPVFTRFTATLISGAAGWLNALSVDVTDPTYPVVAKLTGSAFSVNLLFEASTDGVNYFAQNVLYDNLQTTQGGQSRTDVYSGFFYESAAVPLPASLPLILIGLGALGIVGRRKGKLS